MRSSLEAVAGGTRGPQRISETSSTLRVETPARHISIIASPADVSRPRWRSTTWDAKVAPLGLGTLSSTFPEIVVRPCLQCPGPCACRLSMRSWRPAFAIWSASSSRSPLSVSSTVFLTSSPRCSLSLGPSNDTITCGMVPLLRSIGSLGRLQSCWGGVMSPMWLPGCQKCEGNCTSSTLIGLSNRKALRTLPLPTTKELYVFEACDG